MTGPTAYPGNLLSSVDAYTQASLVNGIGMTRDEIRDYSVLRAIKTIANGGELPRQSLEATASREVYGKILGRAATVVDEQRFAIPPEILRRDLNVASPGAGGVLADHRNVSFIDVLRNRSVAMRLGATRLLDLLGDVSVPKQTGTATAQWLANEIAQPTESQASFGQLPLSPNFVAAYTEISRKLKLQSSAEAIVMLDLAASIAVEVDRVVIAGSGASGEPVGILYATGVGAVDGTSLGYAGLLECQNSVLNASALVNFDAMGYATTPDVASLLMQRQRFAGTDSPLWTGSMAVGEVSGVRGLSSLQVPEANLIFGDWSQAVIAEWGVLEVAVNPYANFRAGVIGIRGIYHTDIGLRHTASFTAVRSIT